MGARFAAARPRLLGPLWGPDLAVDVGSSSVRVGSAATEQVAAAPARRNGRRAVAGGVVADRGCATEILRELFRRARPFGLARPRVVASLPTDATPAERAALVDAVRAAGASAVVTVPEPLAAAVGSRIDVGSPFAQMVLDVGHGVTDGVVVRAGQVVAAAALRVGTGDLERILAEHLAALGKPADDEVVFELLHELRLERPPWVSGRVQVHTPRAGTVEVDLAPLAEAVGRWRDDVVGVAQRLARKVGDEVGAELVESGAYVTGGGAMLPGMVAAVAAATGLEARRVADPLGAVVLGNRRLLETVTSLGGWD